MGAGQTAMLDSKLRTMKSYVSCGWIKVLRCEATVVRHVATRGLPNDGEILPRAFEGNVVRPSSFWDIKKMELMLASETVDA